MIVRQLILFLSAVAFVFLIMVSGIFISESLKTRDIQEQLLSTVKTSELSLDKQIYANRLKSFLVKYKSIESISVYSENERLFSIISNDNSADSTSYKLRRTFHIKYKNLSMVVIFRLLSDSLLNRTYVFFAVVSFILLFILSFFLGKTFPFRDHIKQKDFNIDHNNSSSQYNTLTVPPSFLYNLSQEIKRAVSFDQDLTLILIEARNKHAIESIRRIMINMGISFDNLYYLLSSTQLSVIIPNTDFDDCLKTLHTLKRMLRNQSYFSRINIGYSSIEARIISAEQLLFEANEALTRCRNDQNAMIFGFKAFLKKYGEILLDKR